MLRAGANITYADCAGFLFVFKARESAHTEVCKLFRNTEDGQKDKQDVQVIFAQALGPAARLCQHYGVSRQRISIGMYSRCG